MIHMHAGELHVSIHTHTEYHLSCIMIAIYTKTAVPAVYLGAFLLDYMFSSCYCILCSWLEISRQSLESMTFRTHALRSGRSGPLKSLPTAKKRKSLPSKSSYCFFQKMTLMTVSHAWNEYSTCMYIQCIIVRHAYCIYSIGLVRVV